MHDKLELAIFFLVLFSFLMDRYNFRSLRKAIREDRLRSEKESTLASMH